MGWVSFVRLGILAVLCFALLFSYVILRKCYLLISYCMEFWIELDGVLC